MSNGIRPLLKAISKETIEQYTKYIEAITPRTEDDILKRWLFAFCSIHTTWENNVRAYKAIEKLNFLSAQDLKDVLEFARVGLHNTKGKYIYSFYNKFRDNPQQYSFSVPQWAARNRDELSKVVDGIGLAKVTFAAELINPKAKVTCLDRHVLRWMTGDTSLNGKMSIDEYRKIEQKWLRMCRDFKLHPIAARHIIWDQVQGKPNMRYWSYVFENNNEGQIFDVKREKKTLSGMEEKIKKTN